MINYNIIVSGLPRSGTSMMMHCLVKSGIPRASESGERETTEKKANMRNIHGFYEGEWTGEVGAVKCLEPIAFDQFINPKIILMTRATEKRVDSWGAVREKMEGNAKFVQTKAERIQRMEKRQNKVWGRIREHDHIEIDYDTFVKTPEVYRKKFNNYLPDVDFDKLIEGIDKDLYINRGDKDVTGNRSSKGNADATTDSEFVKCPKRTDTNVPRSDFQFNMAYGWGNTARDI